MNYYKVLQVDPSAEPEVIEVAAMLVSLVSFFVYFAAANKQVEAVNKKGADGK